jgi:hypothetical protein
MFLPEINKIIADYCAKYQLLPWVNLDKLDLIVLCSNHRCIHLLENNLDKLDKEYNTKISEGAYIYIKPLLSYFLG